jgi:hypothetical protein
MERTGFIRVAALAEQVVRNERVEEVDMAMTRRPALRVLRRKVTPWIFWLRLVSLLAVTTADLLWIVRALAHGVT